MLMGMTLPQNLDTDLLRAFVLIADGHSFTQAAARVGRTQSAISMQVKRLEEALGQPVLSRGKGGGNELTPHGHYLLSRARHYNEVSLAGALWSLRWTVDAWAQSAEVALAGGVVLRHATRGAQAAEDVARNNTHDAHHHLWDIDRILARQ